MLYNKQMIWIDKNNEPDTYAEFIGKFHADGSEKVWLKIACVGHFAVYLNEKLVYFGESADYPHYKLYHKKEITTFCEKENEIRIQVWYEGVETHNSINDDAGVFFEISQGKRVLLESDEHILSRQNTCYKNGYCKRIVGMLGLSFYYDNTVDNTLPFTSSVERKTYDVMHLRKTGEVHLGKRHRAKWTKNEGGYLIDLGEEVVGYLDVEFSSPKAQKLLISYSEYLVEGKVPRIMWGGGMDFSVELHAKAGKNVFLHPLRRLAGRYIQIACEEPLEIVYAGLRPTDRTVITKKRCFEDELLQNIYDVSVNTLKKCMHEHYEDCPWREQSMYVLDSRNQMLCGYYAFQGSQYQRENLLFIAQGQREDGLLTHCFPTRNETAIPFFSLVYPTLVRDYLEHTGDTSVLRQVKPVIDRIFQTFEERIDEKGLIAKFPYPFWNYYEWSEGSDSIHDLHRTADEPYEKQYDLILNCMYVLACRNYEWLYGLDLKAEAMVSAIHDTFWDNEKGLYRLSTEGENCSQLGNSFALLIGLGDKNLAERIKTDKSLIPVTLSASTFYYDALLAASDKNTAFVIADIKRKYKNMLDQGATTFWETERAMDNPDAGESLCHGWSAIPVYYLSVLL